VQTLDSLTVLPEGALTSPAARRNAEAILRVLRAHLPARGSVLEIASGSGEHAAAFAAALPHLDWTPSDPSDQARESIAAWSRQLAVSNLNPPLALDASDPMTWPTDTFDALYCANMTHISPWSATEGLMDLAGRVLRRPGGLLALYGPYREFEVPLAESNAAFDASLKARNVDWGLRDREAVEALARSHGLAATLRVQMPANNLILLFRAV
jgi:SAM-dependent methyltransferase